MRFSYFESDTVKLFPAENSTEPGKPAIQIARNGFIANSIQVQSGRAGYQTNHTARLNCLSIYSDEIAILSKWIAKLVQPNPKFNSNPVELDFQIAQLNSTPTEPIKHNLS